MCKESLVSYAGAGIPYKDPSLPPPASPHTPGCPASVSASMGCLCASPDETHLFKIALRTEFIPYHKSTDSNTKTRDVTISKSRSTIVPNRDIYNDN